MGGTISYRIHRTLAELSRNGPWHKLLTLTAWGYGDPKLDLRNWQEKDDRLAPGRGITLTEEEAWELLDALQIYLDEE